MIPVYNGAVHIGETLASAAGQSVPVTEIIVVDDGSTDATAEGVRGFPDPRVHYLRQERAGAAAARNLGIAQCSGDVLAFLDADDLWHCNKVALQLAALDRGQGDLIFCHVDEFLSPDLAPDEAARLVPKIGVRGPIPSATLVRRRDFDRVGAFDTHWRTGEFIEWYSRAIDHGLVAAILPETLVHRRLHAGNHGRRERDLRIQYAQLLKTTLDRRRAKAGS